MGKDIDDGGAAFPLNAPSGTPDYMPSRDGMSLRDYFAGQVVGHILHSLMVGDTKAFRTVMDAHPGMASHDVVAKFAFLQADVMIARRNMEGDQ